MADAVLDIAAPTSRLAAPPRRGRRRSPFRWVSLALLIVLVLATLFPFFLALLNASKSSVEYAQHGPL